MMAGVGAKGGLCTKTTFPPPPPPLVFTITSHLPVKLIGIKKFRGRRRGWVLKSSSSTPTTDNNLQTTAVVTAANPSYSGSLDSGSEVIRKFYGGINGRDLASVEQLIGEDCVYEDLVFPQPFVGRKAILEFFQKFIDSISKDLQFAIDDISQEDTTAVGVTWHLEWKGKPFPFSKGCSFYRLEVVNGQRKIVYGRDIVEPAIKPGDLALIQDTECMVMDTYGPFPVSKTYLALTLLLQMWKNDRTHLVLGIHSVQQSA